MTDTNDISNVQDANCKDDSDMDDIEIELEIHVSPKKPASADKPTALSNHGGEKSQIVQSSKSSIRYFVVKFFYSFAFSLCNCIYGNFLVKCILFLLWIFS